MANKTPRLCDLKRRNKSLKKILREENKRKADILKYIKENGEMEIRIGGVRNRD